MVVRLEEKTSTSCLELDRRRQLEVMLSIPPPALHLPPRLWVGVPSRRLHRPRNLYGEDSSHLCSRRLGHRDQAWALLLHHRPFRRSRSLWQEDWRALRRWETSSAVSPSNISTNASDSYSNREPTPLLFFFASFFQHGRYARAIVPRKGCRRRQRRSPRRRNGVRPRGGRPRRPPFAIRSRILHLTGRVFDGKNQSWKGSERFSFVYEAISSHERSIKCSRLEQPAASSCCSVGERHHRVKEIDKEQAQANQRQWRWNGLVRQWRWHGLVRLQSRRRCRERGRGHWSRLWPRRAPESYERSSEKAEDEEEQEEGPKEETKEETEPRSRSQEAAPSPLIVGESNEK